MKKHLFSLVTLLLAVTSSVSAQTSGYPELDAMVQTWKDAQQTTFGYPASQESNLAQFYQRAYIIDLAGWTKVGEGGNGSVYT